MNIKNLSSRFYNDKDLSAYWAQLRPATNLAHEDEEKWKMRAAFLEEISMQNNVAIMLWNAYTNRFVFMGDKWEILGGYNPALYTAEDGISFSLSKVHPGYLQAVLMMNEKGIQYITAHPEIPINKILISLNIYYRKKNGDYFQVLQQSTIVETDTKGQPLLSLSYMSDVSHIKRADCADMIISSPAGYDIYSYNFDAKTLDAVKPLSEQEKNILTLLGQGFDSKKIAQTLQLSPNTIDTHRRNLIKKTNCVDTTAVVTYAKLTGMI